MLFGSFFAYIPFQFGFATFGRIAGLASFLSAVVSMLQYALTALALWIGYDWVNGLCMCVLLPVLAIPACRMRVAHNAVMVTDAETADRDASSHAAGGESESSQKCISNISKGCLPGMESKGTSSRVTNCSRQCVPLGTFRSCAEFQ